MNLLLFEDAQVDRLEPVAAGRPAWAITCAAQRLVDWASRFPGRKATVVRPILAELVSGEWSGTFEELDDSEAWTLCVNARLAPLAGTLAVLDDWSSVNTARHVVARDVLVAAIVPTASLAKQTLTVDSFQPRLIDATASEAVELELELFQDVHDLVRINSAAFGDTLASRLAREPWHEIADGVYSADPQFSLPHLVACETKKGPILLSAGCHIQPFVYLQGPLFIGPDNRIAEHAAIKDCVATGPHCKLGGEIESVVFEGFSNKQHHGFLGHSHVGSWVNLGAGTSNSDLKNTYGMVNMGSGERRIATGMQFVGCFLGDYVKTAINTSIYTGKRVGFGSMVYGECDQDVPPFVNWRRDALSEVDASVIIRTQQRMFARRGRTPDERDVRLIEELHRGTTALRAGITRA